MSTLSIKYNYICNMKNHIIYGLVDTLTENVFYIGMTTDIVNRLSKHKGTIKCNDLSNPDKYNYMNELFMAGGNFNLIIFESDIPDRLLAVEREMFYIAKYKSLGHKLTNMNNGDNKPPSQKGKKLNHGRKILESTPLKKMVYQYDNNKILVNQFISVREAGRITGVDHRSIAEVANKSNPKRHRAGGYFWEYNII